MTGRASWLSAFRGHPRGVLLLSGTEMWERFSYYGMAALLVLFLSASPATGGFGWPEADAVRLYGLYAALVFISPVVGGWLANTWLGERRAILIGGLLIIAGHLLIGAPAYGPWLIQQVSGIPVEEILRTSGVRLGRAVLTENDRAVLAQAVAPPGGPDAMPALVAAWYVKGWSIFAALVLIVAGTGLLKAPISSIVGKLYEAGDPRREAGFTLFMIGIWTGALGSDLIVGALGEKVGWHFGLGVAAAGMMVGMTVYLLGQNRLLGEIGKAPDARRGEGPGLTFTRAERRRLLGLLVMGLFSILFSVAYYQQGGVLHLLIFEHGDRTLFGFVIPATWVMSVTTLSFIILAPLATLLYGRLEARGFAVDAATKQAVGLAAMAGAYAILLFASASFSADPAARIPIGWFLVSYVLFAVGDVCIWPPQISAISCHAPARCQSLMIGAWYIAVGVGTWLASTMGAASYGGGLRWLLTALLSLCIAGVVCLLLLRPWINRLLASEEPAT